MLVGMALACFILSVLFSISLYGYDNLRLSEKGIFLPHKGLSRVLKGEKNFVPYEDIIEVYLGSERHPFVNIRFNRNMKINQYFINIKQNAVNIELVDIERFSEILKEKKVKVYTGAMEDKIPSVSRYFPSG
ncbi:MAG: hypothetical protein AB1779_00095 [Candidatus Thermoplasmatota archaeon]